LLTVVIIMDTSQLSKMNTLQLYQCTSYNCQQ
jgi:hypothetical protein